MLRALTGGRRGSEPGPSSGETRILTLIHRSPVARRGFFFVRVQQVCPRPAGGSLARVGPSPHRPRTLRLGTALRAVLRRKLVARRGDPCGRPGCYPDGLGSIVMGRHKGVPYKPVLRRRLLAPPDASRARRPAPAPTVPGPCALARHYVPFLRRRLLAPPDASRARRPAPAPTVPGPCALARHYVPFLRRRLLGVKMLCRCRR